MWSTYQSVSPASSPSFRVPPSQMPSRERRNSSLETFKLSIISTISKNFFSLSFVYVCVTLECLMGCRRWYIYGPLSLSLTPSLLLSPFSTFLQLVEDAKDSVEAMGQCFLDQVSPLLVSHDYHMIYTVCMQASGFGVYVPYCENKPLSESFLWKYAHAEGTFFSVSVDDGTAWTLVHMLNIVV